MNNSPTLDLHKFSEAFKSEDDLRKKLQVLLTRMPRTQGVEITHGTQEYWKDFIAFESTLLGSYVASLQRGFNESDPINFLMAQHNILAGAGKTLGAVYVRQGFRVALRQFGFLVELPDLSFLQDPVMLKDINELNESLRFVSNFVAQPQ